MTTWILALSSPAVAVVIALWGFRRGDRADRLRMLFEIQERYLAQRARDGRRLIHTRLAGRGADGVRTCTREELTSIGHTLAVMNMIAISVESGLVEEKLVQRSLGRSFASAVDGAADYIDHVEHERGFRPYAYAQRLAAKFRAG
ncbi:hypothetical protein OIB37_02480 [Streptomyces sp. NBC_00820]|uniref:DUF4760 domain-containing protein n=1 Tax=Streptomyces sp. NBC_00820 TaxID=2975842 RepID=UPI002ED184E9|nr:hypothetical protein OIB37_02480 [Streptomyces sp. NBC_00820]